MKMKDTLFKAASEFNKGLEKKEQVRLSSY